MYGLFSGVFAKYLTDFAGLVKVLSVFEGEIKDLFKDFVGFDLVALRGLDSKWIKEDLVGVAYLGGTLALGSAGRTPSINSVYDTLQSGFTFIILFHLNHCIPK